ncbi:MAG: N-formylglutamate amidohydrolase [Planctomycetia bacterium]|nr:N-formylglutamate amidohydrolase [Planctomycetia bacterium]
MADKYELVVTCEHGGCEVPRAYRALFRGRERVLRSHRGCDPGSLVLAKRLARLAAGPLIAAEITRLLVELNRSPGHRQLFSEFTAELSAGERDAILQNYYWPHRQQVEQSVAAALARRKIVLHLGVHTFTPVLRGDVRNADVGLLYDPRSPLETRWSTAWRDALRNRRPDLRVRRNYPYLGRSDGLTTSLRRRFNDGRYAGLELEVNQQWVRRGGSHWLDMQRALYDSLQDALATLGNSKAAGTR